MRRGIKGPRLVRLASAVRHGLAAFPRERRGVAAIEFAFLGLPFLMLICAILMVGFLLYAESTLDYATNRAARQVMLGTVQTSGLTPQKFRETVLCPLLPSPLFDCAGKVVVNLKTITAGPEPTAYFDFVKPDMTSLVVPPLDNSKTGYCVGTGGSYQVIEVLYPMPLVFAFFAASERVVDNKFILMSTATFKNEPFQGASAGC